VVEVTLAVVRDLSDRRAELGPDDIAAFETDVLAGFLLARAAAGLADSTVRGDIGHLDQVRSWFGRPLWEMKPPDADLYLVKSMHGAAKATRVGRALAIQTYFEYLELRHSVEIHNVTGHLVACPIDEMNRPRSGQRMQLRVPPTETEVEGLFGGWRGELATCRKFAPMARGYAASRLMADVGLRVNEARSLDLDDVKWDLGRFGKLHVRQGKGARGSGPRERMVPLINNAGATLRWFIEDVWGQFGGDHTIPGAPLFPSERKHADGTARRVGAGALRDALSDAATRHLPARLAKLTPHVLRHYCASQLYLHGMDLVAIQETLGHAWISSTMNYVHVHRTHVEDAWVAGHERAAQRLKGLQP
jgi:integrase/recombinase XerD